MTIMSKMRKTFATNCVLQGIDVATLMKSLGHTDSTITLEYYAEAQIDMQIEADRKMREGFHMPSSVQSSTTETISAEQRIPCDGPSAAQFA